MEGEGPWIVKTSNSMHTDSCTSDSLYCRTAIYTVTFPDSLLCHHAKHLKDEDLKTPTLHQAKL